MTGMYIAVWAIPLLICLVIAFVSLRREAASVIGLTLGAFFVGLFYLAWTLFCILVVLAVLRFLWAII